MTTDRLFKFILEHVNDAGRSMSFFYKDNLIIFPYFEQHIVLDLMSILFWT